MLGWLAAAMALGIALADASDGDPVWALLPAWLGAGLALRRRQRALGALLLALAAGLSAQASRLAEARAASALAPREALVEGVVARRSGAWNPRWLDLDRVHGAGARRLRVFANEPTALDPWLPGDHLRARLRVAPLGAARNPGDGRRERRHARAGLAASATPVHAALVVARDVPEGPIRRLHATRRRIARALAAAGPGSDLLRGLALGDREAIGDTRREAFVRLGLAHALAVSGLHLAWAVAAVYALACRALVRCTPLAARSDARRLALLPALLCGLAYAGLAGWGVPVRRALLLLGAAALAIARRRPGRAGASLGAAALWILAREPQALFDPGAQLSFGAVAAFVWARRREEKPEPSGDPPGGLRHVGEEALRRSATAIVATAPLLAWHGGGVSTVALVSNLLVLPWLGGVVLPAALLAATATGLALPGAETLASAAARLADATGTRLEAVSSALPALDRPPPALPVCLVSLGLAAWGLGSRGTSRRVAAAFALASLLALAPGARIPPEPPRLVALDVGQGDAALVQARDAAVLVDGGGAWRHWDSGRLRVVPALRALGVARLDLVVASHADLDHRGGLPAVLGAIPTAELWLPWGGGADPDFAALRRAAEANGAIVREVGRGSPTRRLGALRVEPLWPPRAGTGGRNARSLVLRVSVAGGHRVLLPGDLDADAESRLLAVSNDVRADVLLLPHHGSRSSSSPGFLAAVAPRLAIASAPCRGRFGMPHPEVRARLVGRATPLGWTGRDGALRVPLRGPLRVLGHGRPRRCP